MSDQEQISGWAILELMGHRRLAGKLSLVEIAGGSFIRIDLPDTSGGSEATQFYSPSAVYCITPTTEEIATRVGQNASMPVSRWELRAIEPVEKQGVDWEWQQEIHPERFELDPNTPEGGNYPYDPLTEIDPESGVPMMETDASLEAETP